MRHFEESERGTVDAAPAPEQDPIAKDDPDMPSSKSTKSPAFQFYPRDFLVSPKVDRMSMTERGIYITLLSHCWIDHGLPSDLAELAALCRMKPAQFERIWARGTLHRCFELRGDRFLNARLEVERRVQATYSRKQKEKADKRWSKDATALPVQGSGNAPIPSLSFPSHPFPSHPVPSQVETRHAPILTKRRLDAAFEGQRVYVPQRVHSDFMGFRNGAEKELFDWYAVVSEEWSFGARKGDEPGADMFVFWKARYAERWPAAASVATPSARPKPSWAPKAAVQP